MPTRSLKPTGGDSMLQKTITNMAGDNTISAKVLRRRLRQGQNEAQIFNRTDYIRLSEQEQPANIEDEHPNAVTFVIGTTLWRQKQSGKVCKAQKKKKTAQFTLEQSGSDTYKPTYKQMT